MCGCDNRTGYVCPAHDYAAMWRKIRAVKPKQKLVADLVEGIPPPETYIARIRAGLD